MYPRIGNLEDGVNLKHSNIHIINAPVIELSATEIRQMLKEGKNTRPMLPPEVFDYLDGSSFYR